MFVFFCYVLFNPPPSRLLTLYPHILLRPRALTVAGWSWSCLAEIKSEFISDLSLAPLPHLIMDAEQSANVEVTMNHPMCPDNYKS